MIEPALTQLRITEIFCSVQGESRDTGWPTVFVRLTGCPLRCGYCDTEYAFKGGELYDPDDIVRRVSAFATLRVTVTGGEPLAQPACLPLLRSLCDLGLRVSIETSGAMDFTRIDRRVARVVDMKTPGSGEVSRNRYDDLADLDDKDQVKFVICDRRDYEWSKQQCIEYELPNRTEVLFSPVAEQLKPATLADWILDDRLNVRFQVQLHKILWGDVQGK
jgi:7-carboxy-7-deazaguanine synthase